MIIVQRKSTLHLLHDMSTWQTKHILIVTLTFFQNWFKTFYKYLYLAKLIMYLAICRVFKFFSLFKICVVYIPIFVAYLANPTFILCIKKFKTELK